MRLWTLHPALLDSKGLVALWREALLAQAVIRGATKGYRHHPQLIRFHAHASPLHAINGFLAQVHAESLRRGFRFDPSKIGQLLEPLEPIVATESQLEYEWAHLLGKLKARSPDVYAKVAGLKPHANPLFRLAPGPIADWEKP